VHFSPEDGDSIFLRKVGIHQQVDPRADADIRNNMFTADKNWTQARIADTSLKLLKLIRLLLFR
jgi:hypothetical protein